MELQSEEDLPYDVPFRTFLSGFPTDFRRLPVKPDLDPLMNLLFNSCFQDGIAKTLIFVYHNCFGTITLVQKNEIRIIKNLKKEARINFF